MPHLKTRGKKQGRTKGQKDRTHCPLQTNVSRREVNIRWLKPADHISWRRPYGIWHHAIVVEKDVKAKKVLVIHYSKQDRASVVKEWIYTTKEMGKLYRFKYPKKTVDRNPSQKVLWRAKECIAQKNYHLLFNNCEHFATLCKTGRSESVQIRWLRYKLNQTDDITYYVILNEVINAGAKAFIAEGVVELVSKHFSWPGALGVFIIEVGHFVHDRHTFYSSKRTREIIGEDYYTTVTQRAAEGVVGGIMAVLGTYIGGIIGNGIATNNVIIFLGKVAGCAIGNVLGKYLGSIMGLYLGVMFSFIFNWS